MTPSPTTTPDATRTDATQVDALNQELRSEQILNLLPHRYPFALVDRVVEQVPGKRAVARQERHHQRAPVSRPLPWPPPDARRVDCGSHGPGGGG